MDTIGNIIRKRVITIPNHVKNVLKFKNLKPKDIDFILNTITTKHKGDIDEPYAIDFDKIIPEPKAKEDCPKDCIIESAKEAHIEEDEDRPWFDWYGFHCTYWGTKWNAYDCYTKIGKSYIEFIFETAWSSPTPIIETLRLLGYDMEYKYADEDISSSNCGMHIYNHGKLEVLELGVSMEHPDRFARNLWMRY